MARHEFLQEPVNLVDPVHRVPGIRKTLRRRRGVGLLGTTEPRYKQRMRVLAVVDDPRPDGDVPAQGAEDPFAVGFASAAGNEDGMALGVPRGGDAE